MALTILCAARGEGKTTFLQQQVEALASCGRSIGGIAAPAVFGADERLGYDLVDLRNGQRRPLARRVVAPDARPTVGGYAFDAQAINEGQAAIMAAIRQHTQVIAIDEIGPLEFDGEGWAPALEAALHECTPAQTLIITVRPTLVDKLPIRFPAPLWAQAQRFSPPWPTVLETVS